MFDRNGFNEYVREKFTYNKDAQDIIESLVEYGLKNMDYSKGQLSNFINEIVPELSVKEIEQFQNENLDKIYKMNLKIKLTKFIKKNISLKDQQFGDQIF